LLEIKQYYWPILTTTTVNEMTDADELMNAQHFGSDGLDVRIPIRINAQIRIRIPITFVSFNFWRWRRFALCVGRLCSLQSLLLEKAAYDAGRCTRPAHIRELVLLVVFALYSRCCLRKPPTTPAGVHGQLTYGN